MWQCYDSTRINSGHFGGMPYDPWTFLTEGDNHCIERYGGKFFREIGFDVFPKLGMSKGVDLVVKQLLVDKCRISNSRCEVDLECLFCPKAVNVFNARLLRDTAVLQQRFQIGFNNFAAE